MQTHFIIAIFLVVPFVVDGKKIHFGRSKYGNLGEPAGYSGEPLPPEQWFTQKLDHFRPTDLHTWKQRYFVNDSFYDFNNPGPVFLMIGGEGPANPKWMVKGAWIEYAKKFKALCINLEHRYYGKSHPTKDLSTKNLQYLSSSQALADLANFIGAMNIKFRLRKDVKWIAFGGSYPGSLAAWLRLKYPHLVYGAVSSSGPLLAKVNFMEYFQVVVEALREKTGDELCVEQLKAAHKQVVATIKTKPDVVEKEFKLCKPLKDASELDIRNFYSSIADEFADLVQYNDDNRITAERTLRHININSVCDMLTEPSSVSALHRLAEFSALMLAESNETCLDYSYDSMIKTLTNTSRGSGEGSEGGRQWLYQTCTEFGFFQTSAAEPEVFGDMLTLDFFVQQCKDVFGHKFDVGFVGAAAQWTNRAYGALSNAARRVVYVHGSVDPWHALGITYTVDGHSPAIYIRGTAHCANMYPPSPDDPSELVMARLQIVQYLDQWVG